MAERVYLDWNATTPLRPEAKAAMANAWELAGNPSSVHAEGRQARRLVEEARAAVASAVGAQPRNVTFTSGGTEANAMALVPGVRRSSQPPVQRLLVSAIEHASVLTGGRFPADAIGRIGVTPDGLIDLDELRRALAGGPLALVSIMAANNETGAIQPIAEASEIVHSAGSLLHVDAIQALGKIPFDINELAPDLVSLSAHKVGGPKGIGALVAAEGVEGVEPLLRGGGQERGHRAGTENVAGIAGFGAAVTAAMAALKVDAPRLDALRNRLERGLNANGRRHHLLRAGPAAFQYDPVHGSRPAGRNRRDRLRSGRHCSVLRFGLFLRQGPALPRAGSHGIRPKNRPRRRAAQSGLVHVRGGH